MFHTQTIKSTWKEERVTIKKQKKCFYSIVTFISRYYDTISFWRLQTVARLFPGIIVSDSEF